MAKLSSNRPTVFWLCFWLAVTLTACKAVQLAGAVRPGERFAELLAIATWRDLLFVGALFVLGEAVSRIRRLQRATLIVVEGLAMTFGVYGVVNIYVFTYAGSPLNRSLIAIAGGPGDIGSSVAHFCTLPRLVALVGVPMLISILSKLCPRYLGRWKRSHWPVVAIAGVMLFTVIALGRHGSTQRDWLDRPDHRLALNAHWELLSSFLVDRSPDRGIQLGDYPPAYANDFKPADERPASASTFESLLPPHAVRPRNVIVVVIESCPTQSMSLYGFDKDTTPRLRAAADHALVFEGFYAHIGLTVNSLASICLSTYPPPGGWPVTAQRPDLPGVTLAQVLKPAGYRTAFIGGGDSGYLSQDAFLQNRGFDEIADARSLRATQGCEKLFSWGVADRCTIDAALKWLDAGAGPFFLMTWTQQTHHPYALTPGEPVIDFVRGDPAQRDYNTYLNCLHTADAQIGRLLDELAARHLADDTYVIVTADHGEAFGQPHGVWGHGSNVYDENLRVPLMIWNPRLFPKGRRLSQVGGHVDLNPTVVDLLGFPAAKAPWQGRSLFDADRPDRAYGVSVNGDYSLFVREGRWKYVYNATVGRAMLFDVERDPDELKDASAGHRDLCDELHARAAAYLAHDRDHFVRLLKR